MQSKIDGVLEEFVRYTYFTFGMVYSGLMRTYTKFPFTEILAGRT
jgi:hypothetical protein